MSQHIDQLFEKYLNGTCSPEEWQELLTLISQIEENDVDTLSAPMLQLWEKARNKELPSTALLLEREKIYKAVTQSEDSDLSPAVFPVVHRVHFLRTAWFRYAAAVLLLLGGYWVYRVTNYQPPTINQPSALIADIQPGGDKAVLTLADGKQIILDNAANGNLAEQGSTKVIKLTSGQLAYSASNSMRRGVGAEPLYNTISTPRGGQYQIVLSDGSKVWLNAASSIKFPTAFTKNTREVMVSGEAYMEVVKNTKQPFFVHTNKATIQVLGTSFNINAYTDEEAEKTTLIEGSVKVVKDELSDKKGSRQEILLKPGQETVLAPNSQLITRAANIEQTLAWKNGVFQFDQASIPVVMRQLARWYDLEIHYADNISISDKLFKGKLQRSLPLSSILKLLEKGGIHFKLEGRTLTVLP